MSISSSFPSSRLLCLLVFAAVVVYLSLRLPLLPVFYSRYLLLVPFAYISHREEAATSPQVNKWTTCGHFSVMKVARLLYECTFFPELVLNAGVFLFVTGTVNNF